MSSFWVAAIALCLVAAAWLTRPLWWQRSGIPAIERSTGERSTGEPETRPSSRALPIVLALFLFAIVGAGYRLVGSPEGLALGPAERPGAGPVAADKPGSGATIGGLDPQRLASMAALLEERLKAQPDDARGWQMLARSYLLLGDGTKAVEALRTAARLAPNDAGVLTDYADALAMSRDRSLEGEPMQLIERALKLEPENAKALALAGAAAFNRADYKTALAHWEHLLQTQPPDGPYSEQIRGGVAEARRLAGLGDAPAASPIARGRPGAGAPTASTASTASTALTASTTSTPATRISGTVRLAPSLQGRVKPDDTLFVFARAVEGGRMPIAVLRRTAAALPLAFTLDDSMAMSPDAKLSSAGRVVVTARISRSGNAVAQAGDLQGSSTPTAVGASGLEIEIREAVNP